MGADPSESLNSPMIALTVSYDGAAFSGFARQPETVTVQGTLEQALATALRREVPVTGAGWTDAGVHALGQVVSMQARGDDPGAVELTRSLYALAGPHIVVRDVRYARAGFSARYDALSREYRYRIALGPMPPVFTRPVAWWMKGELDVDAMLEGAALLVGKHDFRSFCVTKSAKDLNTIRDIRTLDISSETVLGEETLTVRVVGNSFLHSMVRVIVGTLVEIGRGRRAPTWIPDILEARDRSAAGPTAPGQGLTLWRVEYPEACWLDAPQPSRDRMDTPGSV